MSGTDEAIPILKQIHDQFDVFARYPYTDHSVISNIAIASRPQGYRVTTYPGGSGFGYDGLAIDLTTPGGIFDDGTPIRVETGRDFGGLMIFRTEQSYEDEQGAAMATGTLSNPAAREGLSLPADRGFELFVALHDQIRNLKDPLRDAIEVAGTKIDPTTFAFRESTGSSSYDLKTKTAKHYRSAAYAIRGGNTSLQVRLDATTETDPGERPSEVVVYRSGTIEQQAERSPLSMDALIAFSGLHAVIRKLYQ